MLLLPLLQYSGRVLYALLVQNRNLMSILNFDVTEINDKYGKH